MTKFLRILFKRKLRPITPIQRPRDNEGKYIPYNLAIERAKMMERGK